jgi:hypothetical protein
MLILRGAPTFWPEYGGELDLPKTEENDMNDTTKQGTQGSSGMNPKKFPTSSLTADKTA